MNMDSQKEYEMVFRNIPCKTSEKLQLLNKMIKNSTTKDKLVQYLGDRAKLYYEMHQYGNVLNDIRDIELNQAIDENTEILKWKASIQLTVSNVREPIKTSLISNENNDRRLEFLQRINNENILKLIEDNPKQETCKRKRC